MGKSDKFKPSEGLHLMLLELAGMTASNAIKREQLNDDGMLNTEDASQADQFLKEGANLKRMADKAEGPSKCLLYVRSSLRYFEYIYIVENDTSKLETALELLRNTAGMVEFVIKKCQGMIQLGTTAHNESLLLEYAHLAYLSYILAANLRMRIMSLQSEKLKKFLDPVLKFATKMAKANRVNSAGTVGQYIIPEAEKNLDNDYRNMLIHNGGKDSIIATEYWRLANKLADDLRKSHPQVCRQRIDIFPHIDFLLNHRDIPSKIQQIRDKLNTIYT